MNLNLRTIEDLTAKLFQVKGRYVEMESKCQKLVKLRREVADKENQLAALKLE